MFKTLRSSLFVLLACLIGTALATDPHYAAAQESGETQSSTAVRSVMDRFHKAVVEHDGSTLATLFLPEGSLWLNVLSDKGYGEARAKNPNVQKVRVSSYKDFAKFVSSTSKQLDPEHTHIVIHTDGTIATL